MANKNKLKIYCRLAATAYLLLYFNVINAKEGALLERIYELDGELTTGVCPDELKREPRKLAKEFGCDRVRIEYGYRSKELVQCKLRTDLANEIVHDYNNFIEACKVKQEQ